MVVMPRPIANPVSPVKIDHVRILHVPWLFRLPWFRRFHGYEMGPLILLKHPLAHSSASLIAHELCHVWQDQDHRLRMWWSYVRAGYAENPHEVEQWGPKLLQTGTFATPQPEVANTWPARYRYGLLLLARLLPTVVNSYKLNLFRLGSGPQQDQ